MNAQQMNRISTEYQRMKEMVLSAAEIQCCEDGCNRHRETRQYCNMHYARLRRAGMVRAGEPFIKPSEPHRFIIELLSKDRGDDCVMWPFSQTGGYGHFRLKNITYRAHRFICEIVNGPKPNKGMHAAHSCGNSICCNPSHLAWKTPLENIRDKALHGTVLKGTSHHQAKLTESDVVLIRSLRGKVSRKELAARYGCGRSTIDNIIDRTTWRHL